MKNIAKITRKSFAHQCFLIKLFCACQPFSTTSDDGATSTWSGCFVSDVLSITKYIVSFLQFDVNNQFSSYRSRLKRGLEPKFSLNFANIFEKCKIKRNFSLEKLMCPIWDDVGTYLTQTINPKEKVSLLVAISYFKTKEKMQLILILYDMTRGHRYWKM